MEEVHIKHLMPKNAPLYEPIFYLVGQVVRFTKESPYYAEYLKPNHWYIILDVERVREGTLLTLMEDKISENKNI